MDVCVGRCGCVYGYVVLWMGSESGYMVNLMWIHVKRLLRVM